MDHYYITGTSTGLGKAIAELCLEEGHTVTGISRHSTISHHCYHHVNVDLSDLPALENFSFPEPEGDRRIVLINNAGIVDPVKYAGRADTVEIIRNFTLDLIAPAVLSNLFIKSFQAHETEMTIVNISSGAASRPVDGWSCYCGAKAGLEMYSRVLAMEQEIQESGLRVMSIAPGIVDTPMQERIRESEGTNFKRVQEFIEYKEAGELADPRVPARKIIDAIQNSKNIQNVVFSVKG